MTKEKSSAKRKWYWTGAIAVAVVALGAIFWGMFFGITLRLTESEIQGYVNAALPKTYQDITVDTADVSIEDALTVRLAMHGSRFGQDFSLTANAVGEPFYNPFDGAFYFTPADIVVETFAYNGATPAEAIGAAVDRYITNEGLANLINDAAPTLEGWVTDLAENAAIFSLERVPIYTVKDDMKGFAIQAFLNSVATDGDMLVISFTLMRLVWWMFILVLAIASSVGFMVALARHPGWGVASLAAMSFGE